MAGDAIVGGFLMVASADGDIDEREVTAFLGALANLRDPLLIRMRDASGDPRPVLERLMKDPQLVMVGLMSAHALFEREEGGSKARRELMNMLRDVAFADDEVHDREQLALDMIQDMLFEGKTDRRPQRAFPVAVYGVILVVGLVALALCGWSCFG